MAAKRADLIKCNTMRDSKIWQKDIKANYNNK